MVPRVLARVGESTEPNDTSRRNIELIHKPGAPRCAWRRSPKSGIGVATPAADRGNRLRGRLRSVVLHRGRM